MKDPFRGGKNLSFVYDGHHINEKVLMENDWDLNGELIGRDNIIFSNFLAKGGLRNPQRPGGLRSIPVEPLQGHLDMFLFHMGQRIIR